MWVIVFFFFSSRRRHTRWTGDWSSDVCSSDLGESAFRAELARRPAVAKQAALLDSIAAVVRDRLAVYRRAYAFIPDPDLRSEERRVGKEGRERSGPYQCKKEKRYEE